MIKQITKIRKYLEQEATSRFQGMQIIEYKELEKAFLYNIKQGNFEFIIILQDLKTGPKINFCFHQPFTKEEKAYWSGRYDFRVFNDLESRDYNFTRSTLQIKGYEEDKPIRVVMSRTIDTLIKFRRDLKWALVMGKNKEATQ